MTYASRQLELPLWCQLDTAGPGTLRRLGLGVGQLAPLLKLARDHLLVTPVQVALGLAEALHLGDVRVEGQEGVALKKEK